jgi:hypothetical protein
MADIASICLRLGMHQDAIVLQKNVLQLYRYSVSDNHPDTCECHSHQILDFSLLDEQRYCHGGPCIHIPHTAPASRRFGIARQSFENSKSHSSSKTSADRCCVSEADFDLF